MKKKTTTAARKWKKNLKAKPNVYAETKKILNSFLPFPPGDDDVQFLGPDEVVAFDMGGIIRRTTAGKIAEAVANGKRINRQILPDLDPEKVLTGEVKAKIKSSFDNILNTPSKEPTDLPNYEQPTSYSFELKPTDVFNITVDGRELNMSGQTLREAFEARIAHDENRFHKAMDTFTDFKRFLVNMNDELVLVVPNKAVIRIKGHEVVDAIEQKDQVENLRHEAEVLTQWKNEALEIFKKWEAVESYVTAANNTKDWGRSIPDLVLERLKGNVKQPPPTPWVESPKVTNQREHTPEELVERFLNQLDGCETFYPFVLEAINDRLLTKLENAASMASETSAITRKRFEEAVSILQRVSPPKKY